MGENKWWKVTKYKSSSFVCTATIIEDSSTLLTGSSTDRGSLMAFAAEDSGADV